MDVKTEDTVEEIKDEISALENKIEQIRVANAFLRYSSMTSHSTPKSYASTTVLKTQRETDAGVVSDRPFDFPMREDTRMKDTYNGTRPRIKFSMPYRVYGQSELQNLKRNF